MTADCRKHKKRCGRDGIRIMDNGNKKTKVLIIDDDPYISEMYLLKFKEAGFDVETGADGKEAIEKTTSWTPDVLLLDIVMPVYDGFDVLRRLGEAGILSKVKVVLLTNLGQREDIERGMKLGAVEYIVKAHFTPSEVVEKVNQLLSK
ncbi:MAG: Response regulator receiver domain protein (CheY-like) [Parcubacteria group bacterium GW2011_GWC2_52_8c]|nr:MAG: Response regulator receiver domain protein (CheY-like) [Parcubacteria group bacterium GW2011_GWA1_51_12]KKW31336.1 MAG: Response regulator receiver domain protein (CheY-like) [Parcubacteria group bacterium GW2011_GWC2_52_8c]